MIILKHFRSFNHRIIIRPHCTLIMLIRWTLQKTCQVATNVNSKALYILFVIAGLLGCNAHLLCLLGGLIKELMLEIVFLCCSKAMNEIRSNQASQVERILHNNKLMDFPD